MRNSFLSALGRPSWKVSAAVLSSYSVENPLAPAFEERNSRADVISGVLKTRKTESCILQVCKFLITNPIRDHFQENFSKFQYTVTTFG